MQTVAQSWLVYRLTRSGLKLGAVGFASQIPVFLFAPLGGIVADRSNRSLSALTVISTLLLPPTFVAGAFGMNVGGIPWAQNPQGFWAALGLCAFLVFIGYVVLRRFRILP